VSVKHEPGRNSERPANQLLRQLSDNDFKLLASHIDVVELTSGHIICNPGDIVETMIFPCGPALISFVVALEDGSDVDVALVGDEGAAGGIVGSAGLPIFFRLVIRFGGVFARVPITALADARRRSTTLADLFTRYGDALLAQAFQAIACNAVHSIEQRAAKWILGISAHVEQPVVSFTHDELAALLGIGRSYASRVIQSFKARGLLETRRGALLIKDRAGLEARSCRCDLAVTQHRSELLGLPARH